MRLDRYLRLLLALRRRHFSILLAIVISRGVVADFPIAG